MSPARHASDAQMDAATWCRHLVPDGSVYAFLADHRHQLFPPELFADVVRHGGGHPSVPAEVVATVWCCKPLRPGSISDSWPMARRDVPGGGGLRRHQASFVHDQEKAPRVAS